MACLTANVLEYKLSVVVVVSVVSELRGTYHQTHLFRVINDAKRTQKQIPHR